MIFDKEHLKNEEIYTHSLSVYNLSNCYLQYGLNNIFFIMQSNAS